MRGKLVTIFAVLSLVAGCRGLPQPAALPDAHHLSVEQLEFVSDFKLLANDPLVRDLVDEREHVCSTLGLPCSDEVVTVYLFRDANTYGEFLARHFPGVPSRRAFFVETESKLAVYAHWSERMPEDLRHEVAHGYLHAVVPNLPLWLDEGLAEFFEVPRGHNGLNRPHLELLSDMMRHNGWKPDLTRLEQLRDAAQMNQPDYAESWAWVYALLHSEPEQRKVLTDYLADLRERGTNEPLSRRLAANSAEPEQSLAKYLAGLQKDANLR